MKHERQQGCLQHDFLYSSHLILPTLANTAWMLSKWRQARKHKKNWLRLLFLPLFAMLTTPRPPCTNRESNSSGKETIVCCCCCCCVVLLLELLAVFEEGAQRDSPPVPSPFVVSPP